MKLSRLIAPALLLITPTYCPVAAADPAISLQHLLTNADCEEVPNLTGTWAAKDGDLSGSWTIQPLPNNKYRLLGEGENSSDPNRPAFDLCVGHLGGYLFFDAVFQAVTADGKKSLLSEDDTLFWLPLHLIGRLEIDRDSVRFRLLSDEWIRAEVTSGRLQLTYTQFDEADCLLTASTNELKQLATRFGSDVDAFSYAESFERQPD